MEEDVREKKERHDNVKDRGREVGRGGKKEGGRQREKSNPLGNSLCLPLFLLLETLFHAS